MAGQCHDHARVDAAGKISADWNIRPQSLLAGLQQKLFEIIYESLRIFTQCLRTLIGKIHFPKRSLLHRCTRTVAVCGRDAQEMPGREELDTFKTSSWTGHRRKSE